MTHAGGMLRRLTSSRRLRASFGDTAAMAAPRHGDERAPGAGRARQGLHRLPTPVGPEVHATHVGQPLRPSDRHAELGPRRRVLCLEALHVTVEQVGVVRHALGVHQVGDERVVRPSAAARSRASRTHRSQSASAEKLGSNPPVWRTTDVRAMTDERRPG